MIDVLVVDDEPLMRAEMRDAITRLWPEAQVVGEATNGAEALQLNSELHPHIVFLDIEMPTMDGLQAAPFLAEDAHVVFVTAYNEHALKAFELGAVDYVLKPIDSGRLYMTLTRLRKRLDQRPDQARAAAVAGEIVTTSPATRLSWIHASAGNVTRIITVDEILYFQSDSKYTRVAVADGTDAIIRKTIKELAPELDPAVFVQIHRSTLINLRRVDRVTKDGDGHMEVAMHGRSERLGVSVAYQPVFRAM